MQAVKNKKLTYLLICAVVGVWGVILYQFFLNDAGGDYKLQNSAVPNKNEPYDQYVAKPDTFKLSLNYPDPFVGAPVDEPVKPVVQAQTAQFVPMPIEPLIDWSGIRYLGYVVNPGSKKLVTILQVHGEERMLSDGGFFQGVKLLKNKRDSILISWQGKRKYIKQ